MTADAQKVRRPRSDVLEAILSLVFLFLVFRFTAAAAFLVLVLLYRFFPLHRSRRAIIVTYALFFAALLIPIDVYIPGFHGPFIHSKHSGPRFARVVYGRAWPRDGCEAILGGCVSGIHPVILRLVWD